MTDVVVRGPGNRKSKVMDMRRGGKLTGTHTGLPKLDPEVAKATKDALMNELVGGMSEQRFWATFVQCLACKAVTLRKNFAIGHVCGGSRDRGHPYTRPNSPTPYSTGFSGVSSSPVPTEIIEHDVFGNVEYAPIGDLQGDLADAASEPAMVSEDAIADDSAADEVSSVLTDDSFVLPTVAEILASYRRTQPRSDVDEA